MVNMKKINFLITGEGLSSTTFNFIKSGAGFTLIEVLIYIAFFTLLVGTLLGIAYQTIAAAGQINNKIVLQQEADFILRKIDWALSGAAAAAAGPKPSDITITRFSAPVTVIFSQNGNYIYINSGMGEMGLNSANVAVSNLVFTKIQPPLRPAEIQVSFGLANAADPSVIQNFQLVKYLRQ